MPGFDGTGPGGMGPMTGGGRGFCNPWGGNLRGYRRYGGFAGRAYGYPYPDMRYAVNGPAPFYGQRTRQQDLDLLKNQAEAMKAHLAQIETMIADLEK